MTACIKGLKNQSDLDGFSVFSVFGLDRFHCICHLLCYDVLYNCLQILAFPVKVWIINFVFKLTDAKENYYLKKIW